MRSLTEQLGGGDDIIWAEERHIIPKGIGRVWTQGLTAGRYMRGRRGDEHCLKRRKLASNHNTDGEYSSKREQRSPSATQMMPYLMRCRIRRRPRGHLHILCYDIRAADLGESVHGHINRLSPSILEFMHVHSCSLVSASCQSLG